MCKINKVIYPYFFLMKDQCSQLHFKNSSISSFIYEILYFSFNKIPYIPGFAFERCPSLVRYFTNNYSLMTMVLYDTPMNSRAPPLPQ